jgi:cell division protein FtsW (lipid II flippase)
MAIVVGRSAQSLAIRMKTWLGENWWWVIPSALGLVHIALTVIKHRKIARVPGSSWQSHLDAATKTLLAAFALLLGYGAFASGWLIGTIPATFMAIVLLAPNRTGFILPNWGRYLGYLALFVIFVAAFPLKADG